MAGPGRLASVIPDSLGGVGNSLAGSVCSFDSKRSAATVTLFPPLSASMRMSVSGRAFTISKSFFAGSVSVPGFETVASQRLRNATSRSVASRDTAPLLASISTFARIGMVFLRSTMPWRRDNSLSRSFLRTTNSMCRTGLSRSLLVGGSIYFFKKIKKTRDYSSNKRVLERAIPADYLLNINELPCAWICGYRGGKTGHNVFKNRPPPFCTSCPQRFTGQACGKTVFTAADALLQRLHQGVDLVVENRICLPQFLDFSDGVDHRRVVFAAKTLADFRQRRARQVLAKIHGHLPR